ncbi:MAG: MmcQ/YjbR family DNA-binding protein [Bacteroidetes bacterium]|nr:MmcQ/YjbR family DNA-binding protein [Bacteroidota bacterium]
MDLESVYNYLTQKKGAVEEFPFGPQALVFKVMGKMFALVAVDALPPSVSLKCDPEQALLWREQYEAVQPGYHMNKKHVILIWTFLLIGVLLKFIKWGNCLKI